MKDKILRLEEFNQLKEIMKSIFTIKRQIKPKKVYII